MFLYKFRSYLLYQHKTHLSTIFPFSGVLKLFSFLDIVEPYLYPTAFSDDYHLLNIFFLFKLLKWTLLSSHSPNKNS